MPAMLPRRFCWRPLWSGTLRMGAYGLFAADIEVARVKHRVDSGWWASTNRHLDQPLRPGARY